MPYDSTSDLPKQTSNLTSKEKRAFKHAFNSAKESGKDEKSAFKIAWSAAKQAGERSPEETVGKSDDLTITGEIAKVDSDRQQVFGWASITEVNGEPVVDLQNDMMDTYELEKAAYDYVLHSRVGGEMHQRVKKDAPKQVGTLIESMVLTPEKIEKMGLPASTPRGWWIGFQVQDEEVWKAVKDKKYSGFSIHGKGLRKQVDMDDIGKALMNRTRQEYDGWLKRMSKVAGKDPDEIDLDLKSWMSSEGHQNPTDDDIHEFLMEAYGGDRDPAEVTKVIAKHLIGRHEQKDHDPTKKGSHSRGNHKEFRQREKLDREADRWDKKSRSSGDAEERFAFRENAEDKRREASHYRPRGDAPGWKSDAGVGAAVGAVGLAALTRGRGAGAIRRAANGAAGATGPKFRDAWAAATRAPGNVARYPGQVVGDWRQSRNYWDTRTMQNLSFAAKRPYLVGGAAGVGLNAVDEGLDAASQRFMERARQRRQEKKKFSKREMELLEKYLGPLDDKDS